ncbi:unnamed protein product, partial [Polarella glacialis]
GKVPDHTARNVLSSSLSSQAARIDLFLGTLDSGKDATIKGRSARGKDGDSSSSGRPGLDLGRRLLVVLKPTSSQGVRLHPDSEGSNAKKEVRGAEAVRVVDHGATQKEAIRRLFDAQVLLQSYEARMGESELQRARRLAALGKAKEKKKKAKKKEKKSSSSSKKPKAPSSSDSEDTGPKEAKEAGEAKEAKEANEAKAAGERAAAEKLEELRSEGRVGPKVTADVAVGAALELQEAKRSAEEKSKHEKEEEKEEKQQEKKEEKEEEKKKDKKEDKKESKKSDKKGKKEDKEKAKKDKKSADKEEKQAKKDEERKQLEKKEKKKEEKEAKRARDLVTLEALRAKTKGASGKPGEGKATNVDAFSFDPTAKRHAPTHEKLSDAALLSAGINPWNMAK